MLGVIFKLCRSTVVYATVWLAAQDAIENLND